MWKSHIRHAFSLKQTGDVKIFLKDSEKANDHTLANVLFDRCGQSPDHSKEKSQLRSVLPK